VSVLDGAGYEDPESFMVVLRNAQAVVTVLMIADARARAPVWIMILRIFLPVLSIQWALARPSVVNRCMESTLKQNRQPASVEPGSVAAV
jgi:uncharacterized protein (DUF983 family)